MFYNEIRKRLGDVWNPFFARFPSLFPIQEKTIPAVLMGENLLVVAPAATGKTEAVLAPLVKRAMDEGWHGASILYVVPTRALVNDIYERVREGCEMLGMEVKKRTGEYRIFRVRGEGATIIITTPESFDSMMCRSPNILLNVRALILDEVHLLLEGPRGGQIRVLMERLRRLKMGEGFNLYLLTATPGDVEWMVGFFGPDLRVVKEERGKRIDMKLIPYKGEGTYREIIEGFRREGVEKALAYCLSRRECERNARHLEIPPFMGRVFVHHASLSRQERERVEKEFFRTFRGIVVATTTLELGIDIGDIDGVILFSPPRDPLSFLQEIGRGCRRGRFLRVYCVFGDEGEKIIFQEFLRMVHLGTIPLQSRALYLDAAAQQILSYIFQKRRRGAGRGSIDRIAAPLFRGSFLSSMNRNRGGEVMAELTRLGGRGPQAAPAFRGGVKGADSRGASNMIVMGQRRGAGVEENLAGDLCPAVVSSIIDHLKRKGVIRERSEGVYELSEKGEILAERGAIHSNIEDERATPVREIKGGNVVGYLDGSEGIEEGAVISLAGRFWDVVSLRRGEIVVARSHGKRGGRAAEGLFSAKGFLSRSFMTGLLVKRTLFPEMEDFRFPFIRSVSTARFERMREALMSGIIPLHVDNGEEGEGMVIIFHFLGQPWGRFAENLLEGKVHSFMDYFWIAAGADVEPIHGIGIKAILKVIKGRMNWLRRYAGTGPFFGYLPEHLQLMTLYGYFHDFIEFMRFAEFREVKMERILPLVEEGIIPLEVVVTPHDEGEGERG